MANQSTTTKQQGKSSWGWLGAFGAVGLLGLLAYAGVKAVIKPPSGIKLVGPLVIDPRWVPWNADFPEAVSISATAENPTDQPATRDISLAINGHVVAKQTLTINPGLQQAVLFNITASPQYNITKVGDYAVTLDGLSGQLTVIATGTIDIQLEQLVLTINNPYNPATSPATDLTSQFWPNEIFYINFYARSYGTLPGSATFTITIKYPDGSTETHSVTFTLDARGGTNDRQLQYLKVYSATPGNYVLSVNGLKDTFAIKAVQVIQVANLDFSTPADLQQWVFATSYGTPYIDANGMLNIYSNGVRVCNDWNCGPGPTYVNGVNPGIGKVTNGQFIVRLMSSANPWTTYGICINQPFVVFRSQMTPTNLSLSGYRFQIGSGPNNNRPDLIIPGGQVVDAQNAPSIPQGTFAVYRVTWFEGFDARGVPATVITVEFQQADGSWLPLIYRTVYSTKEPYIYDYNHSYLNSEVNSVGVGIYGSCSTSAQIDYLKVWKDVDEWA